MLRHTARRRRDRRHPQARARIRIAAQLVLAIGFATFVSVANATAEEATDPAQGTSPSQVVVVVPQQDVQPAPAPAPAPVVEEAAPEAAPDAAPEPAPVVDQPVQEQAAPAPQDTTDTTDTTDASGDEQDATPVTPHREQSARVAPNHNACRGNNTYCRVVNVGGTWVVDDSVGICHATSGAGNTKSGFTYIAQVNADSIVPAGSGANDHGGHSKSNFGDGNYDVGDIIPSFSYGTDADKDGTFDTISTYPGRNLGSTAEPAGVAWAVIFGSAQTGADILGNGCTPVTPAPPTCAAGQLGTPPNCVSQPTIADVSANVCHRTPGGIFQPRTWLVSGGDVTSGHGADAEDIIPAFAYVSGYVPNASNTGFDPVNATFPGRNLSTTYPFDIHVGALVVTVNVTGQWLLDNGCSAPAAPPAIPQQRVTMCHATSNGAFDGYQSTNAFVDDVLTGSHAADQWDVIPSFTYTSGYHWDTSANGGLGDWVADTVTYPGRNLGAFSRTMNLQGVGTVTRNLVGSDLLANGCDVSVPKQPVAQRVPVSMCHADQGNGNDFYTFITTDDDGVLGAGNGNSGHDSHADDVIPAFDYTSGFTYDGATNSWVPTTAHYPGKNLGTFTRVVHLPQVGNVVWTFNGAQMLASGNCSFAQPAPKPPVTATPVTLCHAEAIGGFDTWTQVATDSDGVVGKGGHDADVDDVIPAFDYVVDYTYDATSNTWSPVTFSYFGKNTGSFTRTMFLPGVGNVTRTFTGSDLLANGCSFAATPAQPPVTATPVTACHATTVDGLDTYVPVLTDSTGVLAQGGHDADAFDVIPAFDYVTQYTYDGTTNTWVATTASYPGKNLGSFTRTMTLAGGPTSVTLTGSALLASGTCAMSALPTNPDVTNPTTPTPTPDTPDAGGDTGGDTGGGDTPGSEPSQPSDPDEDTPTIVAGDTDEPTDSLPFTGLELGALLLIAIGAVGTGTAVHARHRRRREERAPVAND